MESQCDYSVYFPAAPVSNVSDYAALPRRNHVYLGETVQFLLVLRFRDGGASLRDLAGSLVAVASACAAESRQQAHAEQSCSSEDDWDEEPGAAEPRGERADTNRTFRPCNLLLNPNSAARDGREPVKSALVLDDQVIFCLTVSLDKLPANTLKAKVIVTVWKQEEEKVEVREHGYRTLLQLRHPTHTFRQDLSTFKAQVSTILKVLPPPSVQCQQMTVCGKHVTVLKVLNCSSKDEVCVRDVKILPNYNSSYLPMMPDGSVLVVDNVCHQSAEVTTASFCRVDSESSRLPSTLSALEEQNFLFQLQLQHQSEEDSCEGLEVPLVAVLQWCVAALPLTRYISSCFLLPSIRLDRPRLVMTASCPSAVRPLEHFWVKYTLLNDLQDFLAVRLIWNSEASSAHRGGNKDTGVGAVVCQSPLNNLGHFRKGSTLSFTVAFQILRTGLFELSQHMKLKLQFTASVSTPSLESPMGKSPSPSSPAVRELLGRSHSFSHQQPSRLQHFRSGSVMEQRISASPAGAAMGRAPFPPTDHTIISLDKIAKRECKVLVLEAV
ncbi:trafficking protein particle complex subunit 14-like [Betta splendens]|uniref:Trafficking protein particle complex subunit 14-like n=1 Tax=Betta splendens TaxID=158456 RepID=A0A6P7LQ67_BETSP|nr:trafficking protein particle complex subunit 14-like [Betta splendens]XP_028996350.1 trafficking protein particle complex subunit 14-like [Betta splendens]XP_040925282.1 trafficking protein particle complex subunit 14-like [Betta splendens]XP_055361753.1 trafficking protein particle complex subunit 14-like [Betta splendens]